MAMAATKKAEYGIAVKQHNDDLAIIHNLVFSILFNKLLTELIKSIL